MARALPEPSTGFTAETSGVLQPQPNGPTEGSAVAAAPKPLAPPQGFEKFGWLVTLNISARNCAVRRSLNFQFLEMERSRLWKPVSRKMLRPELPNVPVAGGARTDLPLKLT